MHKADRGGVKEPWPNLAVQWVDLEKVRGKDQSEKFGDLKLETGNV